MAPGTKLHFSGNVSHLYTPSWFCTHLLTNFESSSTKINEFTRFYLWKKPHQKSMNLRTTFLTSQRAGPTRSLSGWAWTQIWWPTGCVRARAVSPWRWGRPEPTPALIIHTAFMSASTSDRIWPCYICACRYFQLNLVHAFQSVVLYLCFQQIQQMAEFAQCHICACSWFRRRPGHLNQLQTLRYHQWSTGCCPMRRCVYKICN